MHDDVYQPRRPRNGALLDSYFHPDLTPRNGNPAVSVSHGSVNVVDGKLEVVRAPATIGKVVIANKDAIIVQALSIELQVRELIEQRPNSGLSELQTVLTSVVDLRSALESAVAAPETGVATKAISLKDALVGWWNANHVSILDRSFNSGLLVAGLMLVAQCGLLPVATITAAIHGKDFTEAMKSLAEILNKLSGSKE